MPTVTIAITHEQEVALEQLLGQLRQPFRDNPIGWRQVFARLVDDLVWMVDKPDSPAAANAARWLRDAGFMDQRVPR